MRFLPIVERELREASRRWGTYWIRVGAAALALAIGGIVLLSFEVSASRPSAIGMRLFVPLVVLVHLYCLLIGIFRTADCLSEEKREGTLGLLFLTDLKGYDIVLGKMAATSLNAIYGALAVLPVLAIPLLAGGVSIGDVWRSGAVAFNNLFFSLAVGMFCSAISRDERKAMGLALLIIVMFAGGLPFFGALLCDWWNTWDPYLAFLVPSPGFAAVAAFEDVAKGTGISPRLSSMFYLSLAITHALSWVLLAAACFIVPRTWQDKASSAAAVRRRARWDVVEHGSAGWRATARRRLLEINPFLWLTGRHRMKYVLVWVFLGSIAALWIVGLIKARHAWTDTVAYTWTMLIVHSVLKVWLVTEATRRFSEDRQSGAMELLLSTPMSVKQIVRGQWLALERQFAAPMFLVLVFDFIFLMAARTDRQWVWLCVAGMVMFAADMVTLPWVGMWRGLNSRKPNRAAALAMAQILILPWVFLVLISIIISISLSSAGGMGGRDLEFEFAVLLWIGLGLGVNAVFGLPARRGLLHEFRRLATTRFEAKTRGRG